VRPGIPEFMTDRAVPAADVVTPNHFELDCLTGRATNTIADVCSAVDLVHARGPRAVLVTSLHARETPEDAIDVVASDRAGRFRVRTPRLPIAVNGAGDAVAALFFGHLLQRGSAAEALSRAVSSVFGVIRRTCEESSQEMLLAAAQEEFIAPSRVFEPERIGG
jgi:pyridoxine kinase